jgi:SAM-dependent methyltransferase
MESEPHHPPLEEYAVMYRVEDSHWWYRGMESITRQLIEQRYSRGDRLRILDAGCGTGAVMGYLSDYGAVVGMDYSAEALRFCRLRKRERLGQASVMCLPCRNEIFDLVASFDVICQFGVTDDLLALREFARVLVPGGRLILRLPGTKWLHGQHDTAADVEKRYSAHEVEAKLRAAGLEPEHISYANTFLFSIAVAKRLTERFFPSQAQRGSDLTLGMGPFNGLLSAVLSSEAPLVARHRLPFGLTVVALARKSGA